MPIRQINESNLPLIQGKSEFLRDNVLNLSSYYDEKNILQKGIIELHFLSSFITHKFKYYVDEDYLYHDSNLRWHNINNWVPSYTFDSTIPMVIFTTFIVAKLYKFNKSFGVLLLIILISLFFYSLDKEVMQRNMFRCMYYEWLLAHPF